MIYPETNQYTDLACNALKNGDSIVYPTDTLYGFGVDATNTNAIQHLNQLKDCLYHFLNVGQTRAD